MYHSTLEEIFQYFIKKKLRLFIKNLILKIEVKCSISIFSKENSKSLSDIQKKNLKEIWIKNMKEIDFNENIEENNISEKLNSQINCSIPFLEKSLRTLYNNSKSIFVEFKDNLNIENIQSIEESIFIENKILFYSSLIEEVKKYDDILIFFISLDENNSTNDMNKEEVNEMKELVIKNLIIIHAKKENMNIRDLNHLSIIEIIKTFFENDNKQIDLPLLTENFANFLQSLFMDKKYLIIINMTQLIKPTFYLEEDYKIKGIELICLQSNDFKNILGIIQIDKRSENILKTCENLIS